MFTIVYITFLYMEKNPFRLSYKKKKNRFSFVFATTPIFEESHRTLNGLENSLFSWHLIDSRLKIQFKTEIPLYSIKYKYKRDVSTRNIHVIYCYYFFSTHRFPTQKHAFCCCCCGNS